MIVFFQAEDGIRDIGVTGVQTCALPICLRAGAPANEGRTRSRPLRGAILGRPAPPRPDGADRLRLPAAPPATAQWPAGGKPAPPVRHPDRPCPPSVARCWLSSPPSPDCDAPNAVKSSSCTGSNESAKVVLGPGERDRPPHSGPVPSERRSQRRRARPMGRPPDDMLTI